MRQIQQVTCRQVFLMVIEGHYTIESQLSQFPAGIEVVYRFGAFCLIYMKR